MKKYECYKDSGVEWMDEIPQHWEVKRLKYMASINDDSLSDKTHDEFKIEYVDISSIETNVGITRTESFLFKEAPSRARRLVKDGDIIVSTVRTYLKAIAKIENPESNLVVSTGFAVIRPRNMVSEFTGYLFYHENLLGEIISRSVGVSYPAINSSEIGTIKIPVPTIPEQTAIAHYLDRKTAEIDALIADKKRLLELYEEEKTAIINQAVTKGLDPDVPMKDSGIEWLGEVPAHWEVSRMKNICRVRQGLQIPIEERFLSQVENSLEYITIRSINNPDQPKEFIENPPNNVICTKSDILMARTGATGEPIINVEGVFHNNFFLIDFNRDEIDRLFLYYFLKSSRIKEYLLLVAGTTTIPDLNHGAFYSTPFYEFSKEEQIEIVNFLESEINRVDKQVKRTQKLIALLTEYRTALISEVVTGKVKVAD